jgi:hypothetical protein
MAKAKGSKAVKPAPVATPVAAPVTTVALPAQVKPATAITNSTAYAVGITPRLRAGHNAACWQLVCSAIANGNPTLNGVLVQYAGVTPTAPVGKVPAHFVGYAVRRGWLVQA